MVVTNEKQSTFLLLSGGYSDIRSIFLSLTYSVRFLEQLSVRASRSRSLARQFRSRAAWRRISLSSRSVPLLAIFYPPAQS
jgi:hypothetical protein